jgi:hypothetical protein
VYIEVMNDTPDKHAEPWQRPHVACVRLATPMMLVAGSGSDSAWWMSPAVTFSHAQITVLPSGSAAAPAQSRPLHSGFR